MAQIVQSRIQQCTVYKRNNANRANKVMLGAMTSGNVLGEYWKINLTELPREGGCTHLLVLVDNFSAWPEAFPCCTNQAR